jgi:L-serine dehydratase
MISVFDLFKIGIGPSSSHTVGPMRAGKAFVDGIVAAAQIGRVARIEIRLFGSLAWTGKGHGTDKAVLLGLAGEVPDTVEAETADAILAAAAAEKRLDLAGGRRIGFDPATDIVFDFVTPTDGHPNTLDFLAFDAAGAEIRRETWYSVGGGFVVRAGDAPPSEDGDVTLPFPYRSGADLLRMSERHGLSIAAMVMANERAWRPEAEVIEHLDRVAATMFVCIERGLVAEGQLPGGLKVKRRAKGIAAKLVEDRLSNIRSPHEVMDHLSLWAIAVNEENAAGGRVVTAPTNGAAGVVPAVLRYYRDFCEGASEQGIRDFLLVATAIGGLFKMNASISGAEVGCQGEVGVACSMASAGLCAALGGTTAQVENAAEIGMEHHLGMTCDPIGGLVQIPCIERNAFGAIKAVNAASLSLKGDGTHRVSLDDVVKTMRETGRDMATKYKETSQGGLAVNVTEC